MSNQYGEPSGDGQEAWGQGGWPQSGPQSQPTQARHAQSGLPQGDYGPQGAQPSQGGYGQDNRGSGYDQPTVNQPRGNQGSYGRPTPPPGYGQQGAYGQQGGYGQQSGYGQSGPYAAPGQPNQPGPGYSQDYNQPYGTPSQPYGQPPMGYQPGPGGPVQPAGYGGGMPYASWLIRVGSYLIDSLPAWVLLAIGGTLAGHGGAGAGIGLIFYLASLGWIGYNRWYRAGRTGQSLGKSATNIRLIDEQTGAPIGGGMAFLRDLAHFVDAIICYVGFLFPLWDNKRQTLADKIVGTVVVKNDAVPPQGYQQQPPQGYGWQ